MEVYYEPSDIVWVKLGPFWWPGEVVDKTNVPELLTESLKREPVAIVKFFDEDGYFEVVKSPEHIFPYNCERKYDFIKKGMDAFRAKNAKMTSFPKDVSAAEVKTGGNANILSDPAFSTERKRNYAAEIFGSPTIKKPRVSTKKRAINSNPIITHRRFLGYDDYEARVLIQSPEEARQEEASPAAEPAKDTTNKQFNCPMCQFTTERLGILMKHTNCHVKEIGFTSRQPIKKPQKRKRRKALSDEDLSDSDKKTKTKRKSPKKKVDETLLADDEKSVNDISNSQHDGGKRTHKKKIPPPTVQEKKDVCTDIIADWDDESNHEDSQNIDTTLDTTLNETQDKLDPAATDTSFVDSSFALNLTDEEDLQSTRIIEAVAEEPEKEKPAEDETTGKDANKSCFDFDENEEETKIPDATSGRKIPRVIPVSERRTFEFDDDEEEEAKKKKILEESEELSKLTEPTIEEVKEAENFEKTYQSLMESTENIDLPDVPNILKNEQNFHSAKAVKYPDKAKEESLDLIEAEVINEKTERPENMVEIVVEQMAENSKVAEDINLEMEETLPEPSKSIHFEKELDEDEVKQTSSKGKMKRKSRYTTRTRKSSRSKPNLSEVESDASILKESTETDEKKGLESARIQVPLLSVPSAAKVEDTVEVHLSTEIKEIEVSSEDTVEVELPTETVKIEEIKFQQDVLEKEEADQSHTNKTFHNDVVESESVKIAELIESDEVTNKPVEKADITEETKKEEENIVVVEESPAICVETAIVTEAAVVVDKSSEVIEVVKSNHTEDKAVDEESLPDPKRRKTTRGNSRSSKSGENSSQATRRGRSKDAEALKLEDSTSSSLLENTNQKEKKSVPTRKSTRWDRKLSNAEKETSHVETPADPAELISPTYEEINNAILGQVETKENVSTHNEGSISMPDPKSKSENDVKLSTNEDDKIDSALISSPNETSTVDNIVKEVKEKENSTDEIVVPEKKPVESTTDKKSQEQSSPKKTGISTRSLDHEKDRKSSHRSPRKEKRSSRSDKDHKKEDSNKTEDSSSHRSSRSGRRSSRHEKEKKDFPEDRKIAEPITKHPKDSPNSKKSGSSKETHSREISIVNDQEGDRKSQNTRKERKSSRTDQDSQKSKPSNEHVLEDQRDHNSFGRSSRRHSRSSKTYHDSSKLPEDKETKASSSSSSSKPQEDSTLSKKEKLDKPQSISKNLTKTPKPVKTDPIKQQFSSPETFAKTKEQKREELKNIFSFDYDEKEMKKRKTYGHKRKPKQIAEAKSMEPEVPQETKVDLIPPEVLNLTQPEDNADCKIEENVIEACSQKLEKANVFSSELKISEQSSQETAVEIDASTEANLVEKEAVTSASEEKKIISIFQVSETDLGRQAGSKDEDQTKTRVLTEDVKENQNNKLTEGAEKSITEASHQEETYIKDSKSESNDKTKQNEEVSGSTEKKESSEKSSKVKRKRKPTRWDQREKTEVDNNQEQTKNQYDNVKTNEEIQLQTLDTDPAKETVENPLISLGLDETSQKEMNDIFSKKESLDLADKNAEQIELIFGSSPLPGLGESDIFTEDREKSETVNQKQELSQLSEEMKKDGSILGVDSGQNSSFEQANDSLESVESQVARITYYEEPVQKEEHQQKGSIFDTPEKNKEPFNQYSPVNKINPETSSTIESVSSKPEESTNYKKESTITPTPKTKKTYLLSEKTKKVTVDKAPEEPKEKSSGIQEPPIPPKSADKTNEIATKLTNPKKRFVKSFEDFELNKKKEKSMEAEKPNTPDVKSETSSLIIGKAPIAFKLKKQFLSKVNSIFDEADEKKEVKFLSKQKSTKNDTFHLKKDPVSSEKIESTGRFDSKSVPKKTETTRKFEAKSAPAKAETPCRFEEITLPDKTEITSRFDEITVPEKKTEIEKPAEVAEIAIQIDKATTEEKPDDVNISQTGHSFLKERLTPDSKTSSSDVLDKCLTVVHSVPEVLPRSVINSTSLPIYSTPSNIRELVEFKELESVIPAPSLEPNDDQIDASKTEIITKNFPLNENEKGETEFVSIDGNLTVVSEKDLAEGQIEITASMPGKKPMTLLSFSMDFSDDSSDASFEAFKKEKIQGITESLESKNVEEEIKEIEPVVDIIEKELEVVDYKEEEPTAINTDQMQEIEIKPKETTETEERSLEVMLDVANDLEIESSSSTPTTALMDKTETKKEEILDTILDDVLKSSKPNESETDHQTDTKAVNVEILSLLSDKITSKSAPETATVKTKSKNTEKSGSPKKIEPVLPPTEDIAVINEPLVIYNTAKSSTVTDMCDLEDHIPSQIVCTKNALINEEVMKVAGINNELTKESTIQNAEPKMSKLLSRLTTDKKEDPISKIKATEIDAKMKEGELKVTKVEPSTPKTLLKAAIKSKTLAYTPKPVNKAIILSEKIIKPAREAAVSASVSSKRTFEDVEDIEPYVIAKTPKIELKRDEIPTTQKILTSSLSKAGVNSPKKFIINTNKQVVAIKKSSGKAKILNQTIIRPAGETIQSKALSEDNVDFDINSMPIVLSDELLTPETIGNIPIVLGEQSQKAGTENLKIIIEKKAQNNPQLVTKSPALTSASAVSPATVRIPIVKRAAPKILQTPKQPQKIIRQVTPSVGAKPPKFVVVTDSTNRTPQVMKRPPNLLRKPVPVTSVASSSPGNPSESTGHKIMIFTNQQGKQQRLLLTPAQQKLFGMQAAGKTMMKSATVAQKSQLVKVQNSSLPSTSKLPGQGIQSPKLVKTTVGTSVTTTPQMKIVPPRKPQKVYLPGNQLNKPPQQKTIVITNQHGQTVRKIQGTNEALLDKQVAEQLEAIKVSSMKAQLKQQEASPRTTVANKQFPASSRKPVVKKPEPKQTMVAQTKPTHLTTTTSGPSRITDQIVPPLYPIKQDKKTEDFLKQATQTKPSQSKPERPLHQLVIQDNAGNQTTITEGQILALPSETVDGQPQSYMLVTLDETGNLTPLNNEALMSLDPSLAGLAGGDLSNMVLQMDAGTSKDNMSQTAQLQAAAPKIVQEKAKPVVKQPVAAPKPAEQVVAPLAQTAAQVQVTCNINGESGQQIILTGDPVATQKFLDSLSDGSTDLANILAGAEGNSFLIQADGQQILINTETNEAPLLQHNTSVVEPPEQGNPMFSTHPVKNQDILAAALADTDVFQQDQVSNQGKLMHSQLSPGQTLFPMNVGNVLETSLTLNSPIMTPLEVPSTNSKRIPDEEADILTTGVPKNVDLPITITDPNIAQTVSHQQVMMASDLQSNLELSLPISETSMSVTSGMNSPSFVYSLPSLGVSEHTEINQKTFSSSMPLLTEDIEESPAFAPIVSKTGETQLPASLNKTDPSLLTTKKHVTEKEGKHDIVQSMSTRRMMKSGGTFIEEGLCTLGAEMCSSLSEPPPEMFDIPMESDGLNFLNKSQNEEKSNPVASGLLMDDNSLEIPVQSQIVATFKDSSQSSDSSSSVSQDKPL